LLIYAAEEFFVEGACPGVLQAFPLFLWQFTGGADIAPVGYQCGLLVFGVFSEHALSILNFFGFDEGTTLFAVESQIEMQERSRIANY
jgi:hypothetical protein